MRVAKIKCPHCGEPITVRQVPSQTEIRSQQAIDTMSRLFDGVNQHLDESIKRLFGEKK